MTEHTPAKALGHGPLQQLSPPGLLDGAARLAVAGVAVAQPNWDGVILLPGDPGHWVHLSAGEVISFQSFLTLRLATALGAGRAADLTALHDTMARPERLAMQLNSAELGGNSDEILGHLIGAELAAARAYWLGQQVIILGEGGIADAYTQVLEAQGVPVTRGDRAASEAAGQAAL
ncbi:2-dehydro-3-deoxygalactonokinase [Rhodobacteraceae bacterium D3-12]|nr:2-dehydro-3-deoxygalactonokinase [Rhodobacteraceae bacterium D3-12]